jgi:hypothetical protein
MTSAANRRRRLSGSNVLEPQGEGPRIAGIDPAKGRARDALSVVRCEITRAGLIEPQGEGPRIEGVGATKWPARDALTLATRNTHRAGLFESSLI